MLSCWLTAVFKQQLHNLRLALFFRFTYLWFSVSPGARADRGFPVALPSTYIYFDTDNHCLSQASHSLTLNKTCFIRRSELPITSFFPPFHFFLLFKCFLFLYTVKAIISKLVSDLCTETKMSNWACRIGTCLYTTHFLYVHILGGAAFVI